MLVTYSNKCFLTVRLLPDLVVVNENVHIYHLLDIGSIKSNALRRAGKEKDKELLAIKHKAIQELNTL